MSSGVYISIAVAVAAFAAGLILGWFQPQLGWICLEEEANLVCARKWQGLLAGLATLGAASVAFFAVFRSEKHSRNLLKTMYQERVDNWLTRDGTLSLIAETLKEDAEFRIETLLQAKIVDSTDIADQSDPNFKMNSVSSRVFTPISAPTHHDIAVAHCSGAVGAAYMELADEIGNFTYFIEDKDLNPTEITDQFGEYRFIDKKISGDDHHSLYVILSKIANKANSTVKLANETRPTRPKWD